MRQVSIPNSQVVAKEYVYTDEDGNEKREVHLVIDLKPDDREDLSLIVRYPDAEWLASLIEILTFYYKPNPWSWISVRQNSWFATTHLKGRSKWLISPTHNSPASISL